MPANLSQSSEDDALDLILPQDIVVGDSYRIKGLLGSGGMGNVYRAEHIILGKDFALKMLAPKQITEENWNRFEAEGKAISKFNHDNIVKIFNMGVDKTGLPYYVMEVLDGLSLRDLIKRHQAPDLNTLLNIFIQVASALQHAHSKGVIHRDVKPSNIMLIESKLTANQAGNATVKYHAMLLDFGIAKVLNLTGLERQRLTATGQVFGTPYYMSPEQCVGDILDCRADIYSFGCALFEALCGRPPFEGNSAIETVMMHLQQEPPSLSETSGLNYSAELESLVARLLEKNKDRRYQTMKQVQEELERAIANKPISRTVKSIGFEKLPEEVTQTVPTPVYEAPGKIRSTVIFTLSVISAAALVTTIAILQTHRQEPNTNHLVQRVENESVVKSGSALKTIEIGEGDEQAKPSEQQVKELEGYLKSKGTIESTSNDSRTATINCPPFRIGEFRFTPVTERNTEFKYSERSVVAQGRVVVPSKEAVILSLDQAKDLLIWQKPEVLERFGATVLSGIRLVHGDTEKVCGDEIIQSLKSWKRLRFVDLETVRLTDKGLRSIDQGPDLLFFSCYGSEISGEELKKYSFVNRVLILRLKHFNDVSELIERFDNTTKLRSLILRTCNNSLSPPALTALRRCQKLVFVELNDCFVDDELLNAINSCPNVEELRIWRCQGLSEKNLSRFRTMRRDLKIDLKIPGELGKDYSKAMKAYPNVKVTVVE